MTRVEPLSWVVIAMTVAVAPAPSASVSSTPSRMRAGSMGPEKLSSIGASGSTPVAPGDGYDERRTGADSGATAGIEPVRSRMARFTGATLMPSVLKFIAPTCSIAS